MGAGHVIATTFNLFAVISLLVSSWNHHSITAAKRRAAPMAYGAIPSHASRGGSRGARTRAIIGVGALCVVAAACAVAGIHALQGTESVSLVSETAALQELAQSDALLASSAPSPAVSSQLQRASVLKKAAGMLEQAQQDKIAKAAAKLQAEEQEEVQVKKAAAKLLAEAHGEEAKEDSTKTIAQEKAAIDAKFEAGKKRVLDQAAAAIGRAEEKKNKVEEALTSKVSTGQKLGANDDLFLEMNPPLNPPDQYDPFANMDPPIIKKSSRAQLAGAKGSSGKAADGRAAAADEQVRDLEQELQKAKAKAADAEAVMMQHLSGSADGDEDEEEESQPDDPAYVAGSEGENWKPTFYEDYEHGKLGPLAESKRIPEDHPAGHKRCRFHDIDCDELWPWGKKKMMKDAPPQRYGKLGDNMLGVFGQDDVVVPTAASGLISHAKPYLDQFDHWPEDSKRNKDLLYGNARQIISQKYTGVGDVYVPLQRLQHMDAQRRAHGQPLADLFFGSWQQGFTKPHDTDVKKGLNMFDQPYRQHYASATGQGHQIFKTKPQHDISEQYGGPLSMGRTKGDDVETWMGTGAKEEDGESPSNQPNAFYP